MEKTGLTKNQEIALRLEAVFRFNDAFRNYERKPWEETKERLQRDENDWAIHRDNLLRLIELLDRDDPNHIPLIAEFYREAGKFEEAVLLINSYTPDSDFIKGMVDKIKEKALAKDNEIFELE